MAQEEYNITEWFKDNELIENAANSDILAIESLQMSDLGEYKCRLRSHENEKLFYESTAVVLAHSSSGEDYLELNNRTVSLGTASLITTTTTTTTESTPIETTATHLQLEENQTTSEILEVLNTTTQIETNNSTAISQLLEVDDEDDNVDVDSSINSTNITTGLLVNNINSRHLAAASSDVKIIESSSDNNSEFDDDLYEEDDYTRLEGLVNNFLYRIVLF